MSRDRALRTRGSTDQSLHLTRYKQHRKIFCSPAAAIRWRLYPTKMHTLLGHPASAACFQNTHKLPCRLWNPPPLSPYLIPTLQAVDWNCWSSWGTRAQTTAYKHCTSLLSEDWMYKMDGKNNLCSYITTTVEKGSLNYPLASWKASITSLNLQNWKKMHMSGFPLSPLPLKDFQKLFQLAVRTTDQTKYSGSFWDTYT